MVDYGLWQERGRKVDLKGLDSAPGWLWFIGFSFWLISLAWFTFYNVEIPNEDFDYLVQ